MAIKVFSTEKCPECRVLKSYLLAAGVKFEEIMVNDSKTIEYIEKKTGQRRVPVVENGEGIVVGFKPEEIKKLISN